MGYYYYYVGHYSPEKYEKEMKDFRKGKRKSRPNGRIWHEVPVRVDYPMPHLRFPADCR